MIFLKKYRIKWCDLYNNTKKELNEFEFFINSENIKNRFYKINETILDYCICGNKKLKKSKKCIKCSNKDRKIKKLPNIDILSQDVKELGYRGTGRKYNVSDTYIRKILNAPIA